MSMGRFGQLLMSGSILASYNPEGNPYSICVGHDGNLWVAGGGFLQMVYGKLPLVVV